MQIFDLTTIRNKIQDDFFLEQLPKGLEQIFCVNSYSPRAYNPDSARKQHIEKVDPFVLLHSCDLFALHCLTLRDSSVMLYGDSEFIVDQIGRIKPTKER